MKQRGSALIIAMMLIATVGAAAFGIARLLYVDTSMSTTYEDGTMAYYAAESGMEEGFLRYKYNMNAKVPVKKWILVQNDPKIFRTNLTLDKVFWGNGGNLEGQPQSDALNHDYTGGNYWPNAIKEQIYDLRMGYLGTYNSANKSYDPKFYHQTDLGDHGISPMDIFNTNFTAGEYSFLSVPKDESRKYDLSNVNLGINGKKLNIGFSFHGVKQGANPFTKARECNAMAEVKFSITNSAGSITKEYKALTSIDPAGCAIFTGIEANKMDAAQGFLAGGWTKTTLGIPFGAYDPNVNDIGYYYKMTDILNNVLNKAGAAKPLYFGIDNPNNDKVIMTIKPLYYPAADVFFATDSCDRDAGTTCASTDITAVVPGPYTYVKTTGYYGGVTRTLEANIDRQSGTLYDLYDYVLFKGN